MPLIQLERSAQIKEKILFIKKFVTEPRTIGSVTPSSPQLVDSMLSNVHWHKTMTIAELGAGTGAMTRALIERRRPSSRLFVFEIDEELRRSLMRETGLGIYDDAARLPEVLASNGGGKADLIVSSLPYAVLPKEVTEAVLDAIRATLSVNGTFVAFQYSLHMKGAFEKLFSHVSTRFVMMNIPPAFVYECRGLKCR